MKHLIIGNSAAGTAAIEAIRKEDKTCDIVQLSDEPHPLYSRCLLSYYLGGTLDLDSIGFREEDFHRKMNVKLHAGTGCRAVSLDPVKRLVTCENGNSYDYDRLLIATGGSAKLPDNIPKGINGIFVLRNLTDVEAIKLKAKESRQAVVLGGGLIGLKAAMAMSAAGLETTVIIRSDRVLSQMVDYDAAQILDRQLYRNEIEVMYESAVTEVLTEDNAITGVKTSKGETVDCQLVIACKGVTPNTQLTDPLDIKKRWGIETDGHMQTSYEHIYAAGDVAETYDIALDDYNVNALWTTAVQQGLVAGANMTGKEEVYSGAVGMNSLNVCNISLISFGITDPKSKSGYKIQVKNQPEANVYKKVVIGKDNRIKGMILMGRNQNAGVLLSLLQRKMDVSAFKEELLSDYFNYGTILKYGGEAELKKHY